MLESDDLIREPAYLVSHGVRPLALVGTIETDPLAMIRVWTKLRVPDEIGLIPAQLGAIPIVHLRKDGVCADVGFAARAWVAETFKYVMDNVPQPHLDRLLGLMLGYSPDAIANNDECLAGEQFPHAATALDALESSSQSHEMVQSHTEEMSPLDSVQFPFRGYNRPDISPTADKSDQY